MSQVSYTLRINSDLKSQLDVQDYLDKKQAFQSYVTQLEAEADKGDFISEAEMSKWVDTWGNSN